MGGLIWPRDCDINVLHCFEYLPDKIYEVILPFSLPLSLFPPSLFYPAPVAPAAHYQPLFLASVSDKEDFIIIFCA